jgi:hypothetical protein
MYISLSNRSDIFATLIKLRKHMRGGKREGAGRPKVDYQRQNVTFTVRSEYVKEIKKVVREKINELNDKMLLNE